MSNCGVAKRVGLTGKLMLAVADLQFLSTIPTTGTISMIGPSVYNI